MGHRAKTGLSIGEGTADIADVARAAGVSTTTVSRVINQVATVSEDNRRRVTDAVKRECYSG